MTSIILYTKSGCHLCDEMKQIIIKLNEQFNFEFEVIDIESDVKLFELYKQKIPVLMVDGKMFAKYSVDEDKLKKKLFND